MVRVADELTDNHDRLRWNARYAAAPAASFVAHPLAVEALALALPDGPVLELAAAVRECAAGGGIRAEGRGGGRLRRGP